MTNLMVSAWIAVSAIAVSSIPAPAGELCRDAYFSPATRHYAGRMLHPQIVYALPSEDWPAGDVFPALFLPNGLNLDGVHVLSPESLLFSVDRNAYVSTSAGLRRLKHNRVYRLSAGDGVIIKRDSGWSALGFKPKTLDAIHTAGDGCYSFSVSARESNPAGGWMFPSQVYRACPGEDPELVFNAATLGVDNIDAVHMHGDVVEFSTGRHVYLPGGKRLWSNNTYRCTPSPAGRTCAAADVTLSFEGTSIGLDDLDAFTDGSAVPCEVSGEIPEDADLVLELLGAKLTVPADSLSPGTSVDFAAGDPNDLDPAPNTPSEDPFGPLFTVSFSASEFATAPFVLELPIPASIVSGFYGLVRVEGGLGFDRRTDTGWLLDGGSFDPDSGILTMEFLASAETISVMLVRNTAPAPPPRPAPVAPAGKASDRTTTRATSREGVDAEVLVARSWAVVCRPELFPESVRDQCAQNSFESRIISFGAKLAAETLTDTGFPSGLPKVVSQAALDRWGLPYSIFGAEFDDTEFFAMYMTPAILSDSTVGLYDPSTRWITANSDYLAGETLIHEIFHAVQYLRIPDAWSRDWIIEGTAAAVEPLGPFSAVTDGLEFRYEHGWRDWGYSLNDDGDLRHYEVAEFWLSIDPALAYLSPLFDSLQPNQSVPPISILDEFERVDEGLGDALGTSLPDAYLDLIESRDAHPDYPYCRLDDEFGNPEPYLVICDGERCPLSETLNLQVDLVSAKCFDIEIEAADLECETPELSLELVGDPDAHRFIIDGAIHEPGETIPGSTEFKLWTLNIGFGLVATLPDVILVAECPDTVRITHQFYTSGIHVYVPSGQPFSTFQEGETVNSWEDGSQQSTSQLVRVTVDGSGQTVTNETTPINPIGDGSLSLNYTGSSAGVPGSSSDGRSADAQSQMTVATEIRDETGFEISGSSTAVTDVEGERVFSSYPSARAGSTYAVDFVVDAGAELFVTWGCNMTSASITRDLGLPTVQSLFSISRFLFGSESPNWNCTPVQMTLGPGNYRVHFATSTLPGERDDRDRGGQFSVNVVATPGP